MTSVPQIAQHPDSIRAELGDGRRRLGDEGLLPVVRRHWLLLIVITVACAVIGSLAGNSSDELFEARSRVIVGPFDGELDVIRASSSLVQTYADLATSDTVTTPVAAKYGATDLDDVIDNLHVTGNEVTRIIIIRATADDPDTAADVANAIAAQLASLSADSELAEGKVLSVDAAKPPEGPVKSNQMVFSILGALVGLIVALAIVVIVERLSTTIRDEADVLAVASLPTLATVELDTEHPRDPAARLATIVGTSGAPLRFAIGQVLHAAYPDLEPRLIALVPIDNDAVMPAFVEDFSLAMASLGRSVHVIAARRPTSRRRAVPLADLLGDTPTHAANPMPRGSVTTTWVDVSGPITFESSDLSHAIGSLATADTSVILDLGGIDHSAASLTVPSAAEAIVFVVTLGRSRRTTLEQAVAVLGHSGARLSGVILVKGQGYRYLATTSR